MAGPDDSQRTPELPQDVVAAVLQHLSAKQRASSALVGHDWAAAAASLPSVDVSTSLADQHSCQHTQEWLLQNGGRVSSLQLAGRAIKEQPLLQLPCDGLTQLHSLYINRLQLALYSSSPGQVLLQHHGSHDDSCGCSAATPAAEAAAVLPPLSALAAAALLPQLQDLKVKQCALNMASLQLLSAVTSLTSLHLHGLLVTATAGDTLCTSAQTSSAVRQLLQHLPALTDLGLGTAAWEVVPVQFPAHRPALQRLTLGGGFACSTLAGLPAGLTFLHLQPCGSRCLHVDAGATRLTQLTSLRHLQLTKVDFPAALLSKMSALQRLTLSGAWVGSPFVGAEVHLPDASSKVQQLLAACRQLPQLQQLDFSYMNDSSVACALPVLTQLTALEITEQGMPVERGTLQNVLARKLPQLQVLRLVAEPQHTGPRRTYSWDHRDKPSCLDGSDMRSIPDNCPGLQHLSLLGVVGPSVFVGCIQSLSCLQELCLSGAAFKDQTAAAVAQISSLRSIQWSDSPLTIAGMQRLTALTGLTALEVGRCPAVAGLAGAGACSSGACSSNSTDGELKLQWMPQVSRLYFALHTWAAVVAEDSARGVCQNVLDSMTWQGLPQFN